MPDAAAVDTVLGVAIAGDGCPVALRRGRLGTTPGTGWVPSPLQIGGLELLDWIRVSIVVNEPAAAPMLGAVFMVIRLVAVGAVAAAAGERSSGQTT